MGIIACAQAKSKENLHVQPAFLPAPRPASPRTFTVSSIAHRSITFHNILAPAGVRGRWPGRIHCHPVWKAGARGRYPACSRFPAAQGRPVRIAVTRHTPIAPAWKASACGCYPARSRFPASHGQPVRLPVNSTGYFPHFALRLGCHRTSRPVQAPLFPHTCAAPRAPSQALSAPCRRRHSRVPAPCRSSPSNRPALPPKPSPSHLPHAYCAVAAVRPSGNISPCTRCAPHPAVCRRPISFSLPRVRACACAARSLSSLSLSLS